MKRTFKLLSSQDENCLRGDVPFSVWIDYYSDDNEPIPAKDQVIIDIDHRLFTSYGKFEFWIATGTVMEDSPAALIGKDVLVSVDFRDYTGWVTFS